MPERERQRERERDIYIYIYRERESGQTNDSKLGSDLKDLIFFEKDLSGFLQLPIFLE